MFHDDELLRHDCVAAYRLLTYGDEWAEPPDWVTDVYRLKEEPVGNESQARVEIDLSGVSVYAKDGTPVFTQTGGWNVSSIRVPCGAAAPLVVNGGGFVGCTKDKHDADEKHEVRITW